MSTKEYQARWYDAHREEWNAYQRARYRRLHPVRPALTDAQKVALADIRAFNSLGGMTAAERSVRPGDLEPFYTNGNNR